MVQAVRAAACALLFLVLSTLPVVAGPVTLLSRSDPDRPSGTAGGTKEVVGISADGRYVLLLSDTDNLLAGVEDTHPGKDLFLHDRIAGTTVLVSHAAGDPSTPGNAEVLNAALSADGRWIAFRSAATDLVAGQVDLATDVLFAPDVFLWDRDSDVTRLVSHQAGLPTTAAGGAWVLESPGISADGSRVVFQSGASNLMAGHTGNINAPAAFVYDRAADTNTLVSHASGSATTGRDGGNLALSADGNWVAFVSTGTDLVAGQVDANNSGDLFLFDVATGANVLVSHAAGSAVTAGNAGSSYFDLEPHVSANGSRIAYVSPATNLMAGQVDGNSAQDVFLYDRATGTNTLVSHALSSAVTAGNHGSREPVLSADGLSVSFFSDASDLVTGPAAPAGDIFFYDHTDGTNTRVSRRGFFPSFGSTVPRHELSADGSWIAFLSFSPDLVSGQDDGWFTLDMFLWSRASGEISLVSRTPGSIATAAGGNTGTVRINADGSWIAVTSDSGRLVDGIEDHNGVEDVFLFDRAAGANSLITPRGGAVSAASGGRVAYYNGMVMSNDGRYVAFTSEASNLPGVEQDENNATDVFLSDRIAGVITLVSHARDSASTTADLGSSDPILSADGTTVVFTSDAYTLVPGPLSGPNNQLYLYDRRSGEATLVTHSPSASSNAAGGVAAAGHYSVSGDGRWIAFSFLGSGLIAGMVDGNGAGGDVYLFDRSTGTNTLVSHASSSPAQTGNGSSGAPSISADGRYVAFQSDASDLVPGQTGAGAIFLYYRITGAITRVSSSGESPLAISGDGRWVVFTSSAADVVPGQVDLNSGSDVFLWDRTAGTTLLVSHAAGSPATTGSSRSRLGSFTFTSTAPVLSADGRWVTFTSQAGNLVSGQTGSGEGVFLFDRIAGTVTLVSRSAASPTDLRGADVPAISADGRFVAFASTYDDLVPGQVDRGFSLNYFLYDRIAGTTILASHVPSSAVTSGTIAGGSALIEPVRISADGACVAFQSPMVDLVADDHDGVTDAFLHAHPLPGRDLFTVPPCRIVDTRQAGQGPILTSGLKRTLMIHGVCGIPATARAVVVNVTAAGSSAGGHLILGPGDLAPETAATIDFATGQTRANNAILSLAFDGSGTLAVTPFVGSGGTVHLIVDVSGYFE